MTNTRHIPRVRSTGWLGAFLLVAFFNLLFCHIAYSVGFAEKFPHPAFGYSSVVGESCHNQGVYDERFKGHNVFPLLQGDIYISLPISNGKFESDFSDLTFAFSAASEKGNQDGGDCPNKGRDSSTNSDSGGAKFDIHELFSLQIILLWILSAVIGAFIGHVMSIRR